MRERENKVKKRGKEKRKKERDMGTETQGLTNTASSGHKPVH